MFGDAVTTAEMLVIVVPLTGSIVWGVRDMRRNLKISEASAPVLVEIRDSIRELTHYIKVDYENRTGKKPPPPLPGGR